MIRFLLHSVLDVFSLFLAISPKLWIFGTGVFLEIFLFIYWLIRRKEERLGRGALVCLAFLVFYLVFAFLIATISRQAGSSYRTILIPLKAWLQIFQGSRAKLREVFYNICLLMPLGVLAPPVMRYRCGWKDIFFLAFLYTMAVECTQLLFRLGYFEIDDILNNCLGALIGFGGLSLWRMLLGRIMPRQTQREPGKEGL